MQRPSRVRLPLLRPPLADQVQRDLYESIVAPRRAVAGDLDWLLDDESALRGPFNAMLYAPEVGRTLSALGEAIRFHSTLSSRIRETTILGVAAARRSAYEWYVHEPLARQAGLTESELDSLRIGEDPRFSIHSEDIAHRFVRQRLARQPTSDEEFAAVRSELGETGIVELLALIGYYETLALILEVFEVGAPDESMPFPASRKKTEDG